MLETRCGSAGAGRTFLTMTLVAILLAWAVTGGTRAAAAAAPTAGCANATIVPTDALTRQAAADAVLCLINVERTQRGLGAVAASPLLARAATAHANDMVRRSYFSHVAPNGEDLRRRVARTGYLRGARRPTLGETLACGTGYYGAPAELVKQLMGSSVHRSIITDRRYRDIGVGLALGAAIEGMGEGGSTLTLNFGRR